MTFDKISPQKTLKPKEEHNTVKQEPEKKTEKVKREIKVRFSDNLPERRKSDSSMKNVDRKRPIDAGRRASSDDHKEKIVKSEDSGKKVICYSYMLCKECDQGNRGFRENLGNLYSIMENHGEKKYF